MNRLRKPSRGCATPLPTYYLTKLLALVGLFLFVTAICASVVSANTVAEEFSTDSSLQRGLIVSLNAENPEEVELSTLQNSEYVLGVVNDQSENLVTYAKNNAEISVSLAGEVPIFVSDANGPIARGDFIGASWLEGVGMKAQISDKQKLVGVAIDEFTASDGEVYGEIDTVDGTKNVSVGTIRVRLFDKEGFTAASLAATGLEGFINSLAGRQVSFAKVVAGTIIFLLGLAIAGFFVSSSIRGSFISIGRNPLASTAIYRSLLHITGIAVAIILIGTVLSYIVFVL